MTALPVPSSRRQLATLDQLAAIPEEEIWLAKQKSATDPPRLPARRAPFHARPRHYQRGRTCARSIIAPSSPGSGCSANRKPQSLQPCAVAWRRCPVCSSTWSATALWRVTPSSMLSGRRSIASRAVPAAFSKIQARKILDAPAADTLAGLRDRAILSVGLQVGFRRAEIAALNVGDLHQNRGFDALRVVRKGGRREALAINPQAAQRIRAYLDIAGHGDDLDAPLFRPVRGNRKSRLIASGRMDPDAIDRMVRKYAAQDRPRARLLGAFDARDVHHDRAGKRRAA